MFVIRHMLNILLLMVFFDQYDTLSFVTEPNKSTVAVTGSNQTFTWKLSLTEQQKTERLLVQFGLWDKELDAAKHYLIAIVQEPSGNQTVLRKNNSITKRLYWAGDLAHDYFVALKLFSVKPNDSGNYGIRVRVDGFPPRILQSWFTLSVQDPPPLPPTPPGCKDERSDCKRIAEMTGGGEKLERYCNKWKDDPAVKQCPKTCNMCSKPPAPT
ncbi:hypothetical protein ACROYT_G012632 [Oculina patagonica]